MSRVRASEGPGISLFPFLAVLLCTMGALLVLLVIFSRSAAGNREAEETAALEELAVERDSLRWRIEQLQAMRQKTLDNLSEARMGLAGIEDNARELSDELTSLERELAALATEAKAGDAEDAAAVAALERQLADAEQALAAAKDAAADRPPAYAIVPYDGHNGTHRRPLFIECSLDGVFLQPEGIRLKPSDFEGPPGPGNPLASALRAAREHLAERGRTSASPAQQPYPLLLVRPSGVMAYYAAREAIASWGSDFGYQLVEEHWQLSFPAPDRQLADVERRAIDEARTRLAWLEQVQASRVARQSSQRVQYRAAQTRGGVVVDGGPSVLGDQSRWDWKDTGSDGQGNGQGQGQGVFGSANGGGATDQAGLAGGGPVDGSPYPAGGRSTGGGDAVLGSGTGRYGAGYGPEGGQGSDDSRYVGPSAFASADGAPGDGVWPGGQPAADAGSQFVGGAGGEGGTGSSGSGTDGSGGAGADGSGGDGSGDGPPGSSGNSALASAAGAAGGASGGASGGTADATAGGSGGMSSAMAGQAGAGGAGVSIQTGAGGGDGVASLASSRGANWASMATRDRPVPLSRPVQIECDADELRVLDGGRHRVVKRVPVGIRTAEAVDPLIQAVREHVESWGIAGDRMYWNPRLVLSATPLGADRRDDLESLLAGSGLITVRRDENTVAALPAADALLEEPTVVR